MPFSFVTDPPIPFDELMSGKLTAYSIEAVQTEEATGLQGPDCFVHVDGRSGEPECSFYAFHLRTNNVRRITDAIEELFGAELIARDKMMPVISIEKVGDKGDGLYRSSVNWPHPDSRRRHDFVVTLTLVVRPTDG
jgi:hypothetical protein